MWIRSQDGSALIRSVYIRTFDGIVSDYDSNDGQTILGEYASEAEALKVLDMIQCQHDMDVYEHGPEGMRVFQMPPKGFAKAGGDNHGTD